MSKDLIGIQGASPGGRKPARHRVARKHTTRVGGTLVAVATLVLGVIQFAGAGPASANSIADGGAYTYQGKVEGGPVWVGSFKGQPGMNAVGYCVNGTIAGYPNTGVKYTRAGTLPVSGTLPGTSGITAPQMAYILGKYSNTSSTYAAGLSALMAYDFPAPGTARENQNNYLGSDKSSIISAENAMISAAKKYAGPYKVTVSGLPQGSKDPSLAPVNGTVTVKSAAGYRVSGEKVSLTSGTGTLSQSSVTTGSSGTATFKIKPKNYGTKFYVNAYAAYSATVGRWNPNTNGLYQVLGGLGGTANAKGTGSGYVDPSTVGVNITKLTKGDASKTPQVATFKVVDATTKKTLGTLTTLKGKPTPLAGLTPGDTYTFTETKAPAGDYIPATPFSVKLPTNAKNGYAIVLTDPTIPHPAVTTTASPASASIGNGQTLTDKINVTGDDGEAGTITDVLYGPATPLSVGGKLTCTGISAATYTAAGKLATVTVAIPVGTTSKTFTATGPKVTKAGCYAWAESLTLKPSGAKATSTVTSPNESSLITTPTPKLGTQVTTASTTPGNGRQLVDKVTVTGDDGETYTIDATLYGPVTVSASATDCSTVTLAQYKAAPSQTVAVPIAGTAGDGMGNGTFPVTSATVTAEGCYGWAETMTLATTKATASSPAASPNESTLLGPLHLKVVTNANYDQAQTGHALTDTVTFSGDDGESGTINAKLVEHAPAKDGTCSSLTAADWAKGTTVGTFSTPIVGTSGDGLGNGDYVVTGPVVTKPDCYGWFETASLDTAKETASSTATAPHESTLVTSPALVTQASSEVASPGDVLTDTVKATGITESPTAFNGVLGATLYYMPFSSATQTCSSVSESDWASYIAAHPFVSATDTGATVQTAGYPITKDGSITTKPYTIPANGLGCYTYAETLTLPNSGTSIVSTKPGQVTETTAAITPAVTTQIDHAQLVGAGSLSDTIVLTGTHGQAGSISGELLGPVSPNAQNTCVNVDYSKAAVAGKIAIIATKGDGSFTSSPVSVSKSGCYTFVEAFKLTSTGKTVVNTHPGQSTETALVFSPTVTTQINRTQVTGSGTLNDHIVLSGTFGQAGSISGELLGPVSPNAQGTCVNVDYSKAAVAGNIAIIATKGDGSFTSSGVNVTKPGCYTFVEAFKLTSTGKTVVNTHPGLSTETALVTSLAAGNAKVAGGGVNTGLGANAHGNGVNDALVGGGIAAILAALGALFLIERRRRSQFGE